MTSRSWERLKKIKEDSEASSYADVIKEALRLYEFLWNEDEKGSEFIIKRDSKETIIKLFT